MKKTTENEPDAKEAIRSHALELGFDVVGFAPAALNENARNRLSEFISNGYHGDMGWLAERAQQRSQPIDLWPRVQSVIVVGLNYGSDDDPLEVIGKPERGSISVYARGRDYHDVVKKKLRSLARFIVIRTRQSGRSLVRQELVKHAHPLRHGIFENFGQLLAIQTIEDSANQPQALQQLTRELNIRPARV